MTQTTTPFEELQTKQITELSLENSKLQREVLKLKGELADKNISILTATILLQEVIDNYELE